MKVWQKGGSASAREVAQKVAVIGLHYQRPSYWARRREPRHSQWESVTPLIMYETIVNRSILDTMADCLLSLTKVYKIEVRDVHIPPGVCCWRSELIGSAFWWRRPAGVARWLYFTKIQTNFRCPPSQYSLMLSSVSNDLNKSLIETSLVGIYCRYPDSPYRMNTARLTLSSTRGV